jgi:hypothetical protein
VLFSEGTDAKAEEENKTTGTGVIFSFTPNKAVDLIKELVNAKQAKLYGNKTLATKMIAEINTSGSSLEAFCVSAKNTGSSKKPSYRLYMSPLSTVVTNFSGKIDVSRILQEESFETIYDYLFKNLGESVTPTENDDTINKLPDDKLFSTERATIKRRAPFDFKWRKFT